jgi:anti-anti-sigma factor
MRTEITLEHVGDAARVTVVGELDLACAARFDSTMSGAFELGDRWEIDLGEVLFVDSSGVRCLVRAWRESLRRGAPVAIVGASEPVLRVLRLSGLDRYLL